MDEQSLRDGRNVFHKDLVDQLVGSEDIDGAADLVVVTYALPDVHPFTAVASHLNMLLGGGAQSFSISEQGLAAPFTALRIIAAFQRGGRSERAVLEQTTLPRVEAYSHRVAPGSYCTSVWLDLAQHWQKWRRDHRRVVLRDIDPLSGRGHLALLTASAPVAA
ncbi:hypothetical protein ACIOHA_32160 [Streptomyces anulatus]